MVNEDAPDLETLVEDSRNPHAIRQYIAMGDEISRLQRERDEAERTIGALKHRIGEQTDEIARLTRERDEAVRVAVWAVRNARVNKHRDNAFAFVCWRGAPDELIWFQGEEKIYRALREAMGAREGGGRADG